MIKKNITLTLLAFGLLSCTTSEQYIIKINPQMHKNIAKASHVSKKIAINSLTLPSYLLRYPIAKELSNNQITYLEDYRWAEPLDEALKRELISYLQYHAPHNEIVNYPWGTHPDITLDISINQFIASQKVVTLNATIRVYNRKCDKTHTYNLTYKENFSGKDRDIAQAMNQIFRKLSTKIVNLLRKNDLK